MFNLFYLKLILIVITISPSLFCANLDTSSSSSEEDFQDQDNDVPVDDSLGGPQLQSESRSLGQGQLVGVNDLKEDMEHMKETINASITLLTEEMRINFRNLQHSSSQQYQAIMMEILKTQNMQSQIPPVFQPQAQALIAPGFLEPVPSQRFSARAGNEPFTENLGNQIMVDFGFQHQAGKAEPPFRPLERFSEAFDDWRKPAGVRPYIKVWFFNVTNAAEFLLNGAKLRVEELGPYVYSQKMKKIGINWNDDGTISYKQRCRYNFEPHLSNGSETDMFLLPNIPLLSVVALSADRSKMYKKTLSNLLDILGMEAFMPYTVHDYLWGYQEPLMTLGKQLLPARVLERMSFDKFGVFRDKNGSEHEAFTVYTGKENPQDFGRIHLYKEHVGLGAWGDGDANAPCNLLRGSTDWVTAMGTGVQPHLNSSVPLSLFEPDLCRFIQFQFEQVVNHQGWNSYRYVPIPATFGGVEAFPENKCFCVDGPPCDEKGLFNISPCKYGAPLFISFPHFLHGDPQMVNSIEGLQPDIHRHQSYIDLLPESGISMEAKGRIQFNVQMARVDDIVQASYFQTVLLPVLWVEEGFDDRDMSKLFSEKTK